MEKVNFWADDSTLGRTDAPFNKTVLRRLMMSKVNRPRKTTDPNTESTYVLTSK
jgi:hypothetical protein